MWAAITRKGRAQLPGGDERFVDIADVREMGCPTTTQAVSALRARLGKAVLKEGMRLRRERARAAKERHIPRRSGPAGPG